jgi:pyrimidine operon attenuation protein/uracil phosphoribosyltransferase
MAHEILGGTGAPPGSSSSGSTPGRALAKRLAAGIERIEGNEVPSGASTWELYRDDLDARPRTELGKTDVPEPVDDATVVLVDDVLFTGRTIRAGLDTLADLGRPARVRLRGPRRPGHRELPIRPDFVGRNVPTALDERVTVHVAEIGGEDGVDIEPGGAR